MPELTIGQLSDELWLKLQREAERRGVPIEALAEEAIAKALDARAKRIGRKADVIGLKRP